MLKFLAWWIIGSGILFVFDVVFLAFYCGEMSSEDLDEVCDKIKHKSTGPIHLFATMGFPKVLNRLFIILIFPVYLTMYTINGIKELDEYKRTRNAQN